MEGKGSGAGQDCEEMQSDVFVDWAMDERTCKCVSVRNGNWARGSKGEKEEKVEESRICHFEHASIF